MKTTVLWKASNNDSKFKKGQNFSVYVREYIIAFCSNVASNSKMEMAAQEFARKTVELNHNQGQLSV